MQRVDENGIITNYTYQDGGRTVTEENSEGTVLRTTRQMLDGQVLSVVGAATVPEFHDYTVSGTGLLIETVHYGSEDGAMYRKRVTNGLGQLVEEATAATGGAEKVTSYTYDDHGRVVLTASSGSAAVQTLYDAYGRKALQRVQLGTTHSDDDPLTTRVVSYLTQSGALWEVFTIRQAVDDDSAHDIVSVTKSRVGSAEQVETSHAPDGTVLTQTTTVNRSSATVTMTTTSSQATRPAVRVMINGLVQSETEFNATQATTYEYDGLERPIRVTTPDGVTRQTIYDDVAGGVTRSRVKEERVIPAGGGTAVKKAIYSYNALGQVSTVTNADDTTSTRTYDAAGRVLTQGGTAGYPLRYEYDPLGRLWKLHTYRGANADDVTTWGYDEASGSLTSKTDAAGNAVTYSYDVAGRLQTRTWERGVTATYGYDGAGRLNAINYSDSTPDVTHEYDRAGRRTGTTDAAGTHTFVYDAASGGNLTTWSVGGSGVWSGLAVEHTYSGGQRSSRGTSLGTLELPTVNYGYDAASGRLASVSSGGITATYRYNAATGWNEGVTYSSGLSSTRTADGMGRLDAITWSAGGSTLSGHDYTLDGMNRRTAAQRTDGSKWHYDYNPKGEVTDVSKKDAGGMPEPGKQYGYEFDGIGNRTASTVSSLADDETLRSTSYQADELNQYTQILHPQPGWLVLRGGANAAASVTIDGQPPTVRTGPLWQWHYEKSVDNSGGAVRHIAEISATRPNGGLNNGPVTAKRKGAMFIPPPVETLTYDLDGNQISDARWTYTWDGENRLITAEEGNIPVSVAAGVNPPVATVRQKLEFSYDFQGRRLTKRVYEQRTENGAQGTFVLKESLVFLYDGWNMIAEIDTTVTTSRLLQSYEWGTDLSGTMEGAGGVGGLLVERFHSATTLTAGSNSQPPPSGAHAPLYDGNGNITELVNLANGSVSARYEYGAFGEILSVEGGAVAEVNPFRFSTKYEDEETGMLYYGFRYYQPETGRWLSRDPLGERGGINLYGMVGNNPVNFIDYLGLDTYILLYYSRSDQQAFKQAAETQKREIEVSSTFNKACDKVIIKGALTAQDFESAWSQAKTETTGNDPTLKVKEVRVFSHSGPGELNFRGGSLNTQQIANLSGLNWKPDGKVVCHGCNSGVNNASGQSVAGSFAQGQGVQSQGQSGYSQFSTDPNKRKWFTRIGDSSKSVYLWSHGDGGKDNTFGPTRPPNTVPPPQQPSPAPPTPTPATPTPSPAPPLP